MQRTVDEASKAAGLKININKTKTTVSGRTTPGSWQQRSGECHRVCVSVQFADK